ncbi:TniQ family protein [Achromobacter sp.]|uniref:TniQ family protein n=1 Tax=Achromobacter sp. TaxID=134375 RepID=UPI003C70FE66
MIAVIPMPGEFFAGHYARFARLNRPLTNGKCLPRAMPRAHPGKKVAFLNDHLQVVAEHSQMSPETYWRQHTLHPLVELCRVKTVGGEDQWEQGATARFPSRECCASSAPRLCPKCISEDLEAYGFSYWRRFHQICGVDMCLEHENPLRTSRVTNDFTLQPADHLPTSEAIESALIQATEHEVIRRYHFIAQAILGMAIEGSPSSMSRGVRDRLRNIRQDCSSSPSLLDLITHLVPSIWAERYFPHLMGAEAVRHLRCSFDALMRGRAPGKLVALILAATTRADESSFPGLTLA